MIAAPPTLLRESSARTWTINGRFLSQRITGVQRYAKELTHALGELLQSNGVNCNVEIAAGPGSHIDDALQLPCRRFGRFGGQFWEQVSLPLLSSGGIVSLCNTGPVLCRNHIVCIHDANVFQWPQSYSPSFRTYYRWILPLLGRNATKILTVSKTSADLLVRHQIAFSRNIEIVPNGHEHVYRWQAEKSTVLSMEPARRPFVLVIGSSAPHKNMRLIYKFASELDRRGIDIYISGGSASIFKNGRQLDSPHSNIRHLGYVTDNDLAALYSKALCLAFPSYVEGFGLPLVEAMAFGCQVISSNTSCMPEICGSYATLVPPDDPESWIRAIEKTLLDSDSSSMSVNRSEMTQDHLQNFSWKASAKKLCSILEEY